jgi:hypothetical protein
VLDTIAALVRPALIPRSDVTLLSREWVSGEVARLEAEHTALERSIRFLAEATVGRHELKDSLRALKACCEGAGTRRVGTGGSPEAPAPSLPESQQPPTAWVTSLKKYRAITRCLSAPADASNRLNSSCLFLPSHGPVVGMIGAHDAQDEV